MEKRVLAIMAHPDDIEILCAGTLALLHEKGWKVHMATMTAGDCGTKTLSKAEISAIRLEEAKNAAAILNASYECLGFEDLFITYDKPSITKLVAHIRKVKPQLVITMSPSCYMLDHEITSMLVQTGCFGGGLVNIETPGFTPLDYIPVMYYADAIEGRDRFGKGIECNTFVDITQVIDVKSDMLASHKSQREWLRQHHGMDEYILSMRRHAENRGNDIGVKYAEAFRQHLGHAFPEANLLSMELGNLTHVL
ncbi:MAG: PIG-L family deacetylase [Cyclobacteriaceae bacterium]|nr:PIG-L family deacetylase [Cyclobacteriaceae bacterium]